MTWMQELGDKIRAAREEKGLSQSELASKIEVSRATILHYERGQVSKPLLEVVTRIAATLETNFEIRGCIVGNDRPPVEAPKAEQFCLPFDEESTFEHALVKIRPQKGRLILTAEIPA